MRFNKTDGKDCPHAAADSYAKHVSDQLFKLKSCKVQHPDFNDDRAKEFALAMSSKNTSVRRLEFYKCPSLGLAGIQYIAQALPHSTIEKLDISSIDIGDQGLEALTDAILHKDTILKWLELDDVGPFSLPVWKKFSEAVFSQNKIKSLDLSRNQLQDIHVQSLAEGLRINTALQSLVLSENPIADGGVLILSKVLLFNSTLMLLALGDCKITEYGAMSLLQCLRTNSSLERLYLYANPLDCASSMEKELTFWLELNARGRGYLRRDGCRCELLPPILSRRKISPAIIYGLLHEIPHVWALPK